VIQSTYENPCYYKPGGFNSGFVSVPPRPEGGAGTGVRDQFSYHILTFFLLSVTFSNGDGFCL
jgi:hypothetical protein